jgi:hypothetical protein
MVEFCVSTVFAWEFGSDRVVEATPAAPRGAGTRENAWQRDLRNPELPEWVPYWNPEQLIVGHLMADLIVISSGIGAGRHLTCRRPAWKLGDVR